MPTIAEEAEAVEQADTGDVAGPPGEDLNGDNGGDDGDDGADIPEFETVEAWRDAGSPANANIGTGLGDNGDEPSEPDIELPTVDTFAPSEYAPILGDHPPEPWELGGRASGGYGSRYDDPQGRQEILEDIQRSRESVAATQAMIAGMTLAEKSEYETEQEAMGADSGIEPITNVDKWVDRWSLKIKDNKFIGNKAEFAQYKKDFEAAKKADADVVAAAVAAPRGHPGYIGTKEERKEARRRQKAQKGYSRPISYYMQQIWRDKSRIDKTPAKIATTVTRDTSVKEKELQRENELRDALQFAKDITANKHQLPEGTNEAKYWESIADIKTKYDLLQSSKNVEASYLKAGKSIPPEVQAQLDQIRAITTSEASPFITLTEGGYTTDTGRIASAIKVGIGAEALTRMGINVETIRRAKSFITEEKEQRVTRIEQNQAVANLADYKQDGGYNIDAAISAGLIGDVKKAGFAPQAIKEAEIRVGQVGLVTAPSLIRQPLDLSMGSFLGGTALAAPLSETKEKGFADDLSEVKAPQYTIGAAPPERSTTLWEKVTPWKEERGETFGRWIGGLSKKEAEKQAAAEWMAAGSFQEALRQPEIRYGLPRGISAIGFVPVVGSSAALAYRYPTLSPEARRSAWTSLGAEAALTGMIFGPMLWRPKPALTTSWSLGTSIEQIATGGARRATGIPIRGMSEIPLLEGKLVQYPISYTPETAGTKFAFQSPAIWRAGLEKVADAPKHRYVEVTPGKYIHRPITPEGILGTPKTLAPQKSFMWKQIGGIKEIPEYFKFSASSLESFGQPLRIAMEQSKGGIYLPKYYISKSKIPIEIEWTPGSFYQTKPTTTIPLKGGTPSVDIPSTARMTPEQVARLIGATTQPRYIWYEATAAGLLMPRVSSFPQPKAIPAVKVIPNEIITPITVPVVAPVVISKSVITPVITPVEIVGITTPVLTPIPTLTSVPSLISAPVPTSVKLGIDEPPPITRIDKPPPPPPPPPGMLIPPIYLFPKFPKLRSGRGRSRRSYQPSYTQYFQKIPVLQVYMPIADILGKKAKKKQLEEEDEFGLAPFGGIKQVTEITKEERLRAGAKETIGLTTARDFYIPKKKTVSRKNGKKYSPYGTIQREDIGEMAWVG